VYWNGAFELTNKIAFLNRQDWSWYLDLYDVTTNSWSVGIVNPSSLFWPGYFPGVISHNNTIYFAQGFDGSSYSRQIWKIEF
jgi:hypothetical protein